MARRRYNPDKHGVFCYYCGKGLHPKNATLDHIIPKSRGGVDAHRNLVACCLRCNKLKANLSIEDFRKVFVADYVKIKNPYALQNKFAFEVKYMVRYIPKVNSDPVVQPKPKAVVHQLIVKPRADWVFYE